MQMLEILGARVDHPETNVSYNGIKDLQLWPRVVWVPSFALTFGDLEAKINAKDLHIGTNTSLVIRNPDCLIKSLDMQEGALVLDGSSGKHDVEEVEICNKGWEWAALNDENREQANEIERIRGFKVVKHETEYI